MIAALLNLGFAGGSDPDHADEHTLFIHPDPTTELVRAGYPLKTRYKDPDSTIKVVLDWSDWLGTAAISSVTWTTDPTSVTASNTSNSNTTTTAYLAGGELDAEHRVTVKITTNESVARIEARTFMVHIARVPA